jgi:hypothetical protein
MLRKELEHSINRSLDALNVYVNNYEHSLNRWPYKEVLLVLTLFKERLENGQQFNTRLLRAMKDVYVISFRNFEGSLLHDEIQTIVDHLKGLFSFYESLETLGLDFGNGDPV